MNIYYIPLGSFCYPKMIIRETGREYEESLPFDFNSSPHMLGITNILEELYEKKTYDIELKDILMKYNGDELTVSERNDMYLVHFFKEGDLIENVEEFPVSANMLKEDVVLDVKRKFKKRFERLYDILNNKNNIICFMRIENYDNPGWNYELTKLTATLAKFENPNKYLIYSQQLINDELHFNNSKVLNYDYDIPILFCKHYFYDMEMINNKDLFITFLTTFEYLMNNEYILNICNEDVVEKYYIDKEKSEIYKLTNIKYFSKYYLEEDVLYINNVINEYDRFVKNKNNVYELLN